MSVTDVRSLLLFVHQAGPFFILPWLDIFLRRRELFIRGPIYSPISQPDLSHPYGSGTFPFGFSCEFFLEVRLPCLGSGVLSIDR